EIPFVCSYVNSDSFSLVLSAFVFYGIVHWIQEPNLKSQWVLAVAVGLYLGAKYNFLVAAPFIFLVIGFVCYQQGWPMRSLGWKLLFAMLILSGPWYLRNYYYYHDPLGESFMLSTMAKFNTLGTPRPFNIESWVMLIKRYWIQDVFNSFFAVFGWSNIFLHRWV